MALLTNDKNLVKEFVRISFINSLSSLPNWEVAEQRYLLPLIGDAMYDKLVAIAADNGASDQDRDLLKKARAVIAPLAYLVELPLIHTQLTDAGLRVVETNNMVAAHRWEFNKVEEFLTESGAFAIETLLKFLFKNKADYAEWTSSDEYSELNELIFDTATDFDKCFKTASPFRIFWDFKPLIKEVQDLYINPLIGEDFFIELRDNEAPSTEEKKAIDLIKNAVAQYTIVKAVEKYSVKITTKGFSILLAAANSDSVNAGDDPAASSRTGASTQALSLLYDSCQNTGDAYALKLKEYLNQNASAELFTTFFNSDLYVAPDVVDVDRNDTRTGLIGF